MKKQISNVSGHQTSKVFAISYMVLTIPLLIIGIIMLFVGGTGPGPEGHVGPKFPALFFLFAPLLYGFFGYLFTRLACFTYNVIAKRFGGIEFTLSDTNES
ncbi:MAG: hypothetical protein HY273_15240 [Gammaproteobacteria bacterium]|nr:hypothetical protein [Gammaproteobacteria bacterium]